MRPLSDSSLTARGKAGGRSRSTSWLSSRVPPLSLRFERSQSPEVRLRPPRPRRLFPHGSRAHEALRSPQALFSLQNPRFITFARKDFKEKPLRVAEVLGIEAPEKNLAKILERALDLTLERKDPQKKLE